MPAPVPIDMQTEMTSLLHDWANQPALVGRRKVSRVIVEFLRRYSERGDVNLEKLSGPNYFNRAPSTLKRYCREHDICFPDYVPMHLRKKKTEET